tara:strand:+ start:274 stop:552 length:279 start_codon:yes stop_codon:yes gene_type:complete
MRDKNAEEKFTANNRWRFELGEQVWVATTQLEGFDEWLWVDGLVIERVVESYWGEGRPMKWYEDEMYDVLSNGELQRVHLDRLRATQMTPAE